MDFFSLMANKASDKTHYDRMVSTSDWTWTDEDYIVNIAVSSDNTSITGYHHFDWVIDGLILGKIYELVGETPEGISTRNAIAIDGGSINKNFKGVTILMECNEAGKITGQTMYAVSGARLISSDFSDPDSWEVGDYSEIMTMNFFDAAKEQGVYVKFTLKDYNGHVRVLKRLDSKFLPEEFAEKEGLTYTYTVPEGTFLLEIPFAGFLYQTIDKGYSYYTTNVNATEGTFQIGFGEEVYDTVFSVPLDQLPESERMVYFTKKEKESTVKMYYCNDDMVGVADTYEKGISFSRNHHTVEMISEGTISPYCLSADSAATFAPMLYHLFFSPAPESRFTDKVICYVEDYENGDMVDTAVKPISLLGLVTSQLFGKEKEFFSLKFYNKTTCQFLGKRMYFNIDIMSIPIVEGEDTLDISEWEIKPRQAYTRKGFLELIDKESLSTFFEKMDRFYVIAIGNPGTTLSVTWRE